MTSRRKTAVVVERFLDDGAIGCLAFCCKVVRWRRTNELASRWLNEGSIEEKVAIYRHACASSSRRSCNNKSERLANYKNVWRNQSRTCAMWQ